MITTSQNFANEKSFNLYVNYLALKKHFTTDNYDYHKYNGKVRATFDKFMTRPDVYFFHKLANKDDAKNILLANIIENQDAWIRDIAEESGKEVYLKWRQRIDSLSYTFKSDLRKLKMNWQDNFDVPDGQHPYIMTRYLQKEITLESFTLLTHFAKIFNYWEQNIVDKIIARDIIRLSRKYKPFLEISENKFKEMVRDEFF